MYTPQILSHNCLSPSRSYFYLILAFLKAASTTQNDSGAEAEHMMAPQFRRSTIDAAQSHAKVDTIAESEIVALHRQNFSAMKLIRAGHNSVEPFLARGAIGQKSPFSLLLSFWRSKKKVG